MARGEGRAYFALTLSYSLRVCNLVLSASAQRYWPRQTPPKDAGSPTAPFLSTSGKKRGKETPQGTDGPLTPFGRHLLARNTPYLAFCKNSVLAQIRYCPCLHTVAPAGSWALFTPDNRGAASKAPRFICHRQRFGAFLFLLPPCSEM